ncbi:MAG: oxidoreductase [Opitutae bacterium]|nr:oxidoreductase [Opitutae bacterium]|tara:strand:+ start:1810 stop:2553 length:744 start_codon:yes stop_codon:yes gene_type:complete
MNVTDNLRGKNVLLTGGGSGMGQATALALAKNGANVAIAGRNKENLNATVSLAQATEKISAKEADVTDRNSLENLFQWFDAEFGRLDYLVHAAGINVAMRSMEELSPDDWDRLIQINLTGSYNVLRLTLSRMRPQKKGLIVLINSVAGKRSVPLAGIGYNASKFGMSGLGIGVAEEERNNGIRISNLYPGEVNTPILENRKQPPGEEHRKSILQAEDVASVILHLFQLPERVHIPELVVKPTLQSFV